MTIPALAVTIADPMDPSEILDWGIPFDPVLEDGEGIDDADWTLALGAEAVALGLEIIEGDPDWPDPMIVDDENNEPTIIKFWARVDPSFLGNSAFQSPVPLPIEATIWTTSSPRRRRQRTILIKVVEQ